MATPLKDLIPLSEVCKMLDCSQSLVYSLAERGEIKAISWGQQQRYSRVSIDKYLKKAGVR